MTCWQAERKSPQTHLKVAEKYLLNPVDRMWMDLLALRHGAEECAQDQG
jgi:hypothetical protein